jgi:hypothetical protein
MTQSLKKFILIFIFMHAFVFSYEQQNANSIDSESVIVERIEKICLSIDKNKNLVEAIGEGENADKKWGFEIHDFKDELGILYRTTHISSTDQYCEVIFYYNNKNVIKAIVTITEKNVNKPQYSAIYYFENNKLIKKIGENINYSNYKDILKQGLDFQYKFYKDNHT